MSVTERRKRLWSDDEAEGVDHAWLAPRIRDPHEGRRERSRTEIHPPAPPPPPGPGRWATVRAALLGGVAAAVAVALVLLATGTVGKSEDAPVPLPAAPTVKVPSGGSADGRVAAVYRAASGSVVSIRAATAGGVATGTGFVVDTDGTIVTNSHVVGSSKHVEVRFGDRGRRLTGTVTGSDPSSDLAVVHVDPSGTTLHPLALADSRAVKVGQLAVAIGNPFGLDRTATAGIVSSTGREIQAPNGFSIDSVIQTDAPINPGNSGGPLLNGAGQVIGVNSQIATASGGGGNVGVGFAVPSNTVRQVVPKLRRDGSIARAYLGISVAENPAGSGALVASVPQGGPADRAGLRGGISNGDVIVAIGGHRVRVADDVTAAVSKLKPGQTVKVTVLRDGRQVDVNVKLGTRPARAGTP